MQRQVRELHRYIVFFLGLLILLLSAPSWPDVVRQQPEGGKTVVVVAPDLPQTQGFLSFLRSRSAASYPIRYLDLRELHADPLRDAVLVVALGEQALQEVHARHGEVPVVTTYISESAFEQLPTGKENVVPVFPVMDWSRQLRLARFLIPKSKTAGVLVSPDFLPFLPPLEKAAAAQGFRLEVMRHGDNENLIHELSRLLPKSDFLLALDDRAIFNPNTIKNILLTSYRNGKVVIGPNASYVKAGSLATVGCSEEELAEAVHQGILLMVGQKNVPPPRTLSCNSVTINKQVARSLAITIPEEIRQGKLPPVGESP